MHGLVKNKCLSTTYMFWNQCATPLSMLLQLLLEQDQFDIDQVSSGFKVFEISPLSLEQFCCFDVVDTIVCD